MVEWRPWLEIQRATGVEKRCVDPHPNNRQIGVVEGPCPGCGSVPFLIQASSPEIYDRSTLRANGHAKCCGDAVGFVFVPKDTLFGLEEDRAVLVFGRARVYGLETPRG